MTRENPGPWAEEIHDLARGFSGAYLFGIPLLFTMEMWWIGQYADLWKLVAFLAIAFLANLGLAYFAGFEQAAIFDTPVPQAVKAVAIGVVASVVVLLVLNRIQPGDPLDSILGKVIIQAVPLSIGASVANAVFSSRGEGRAGGSGEGASPWKDTFNDLGATLIGAAFIGFSIAPTEEVPMLAAEMGYWHELALMGLSLAISYAIVFESGFDPCASQQGGQALFQRPITETVVAYFLSLLASLLALYLFDRVELGDPLPYVVSQILVLGLPAAVGGAAGRLAV